MRPWYRFCRLLCWLGFILLFRGRVFGRRNVPRTGGALLVCNHQSFLDPVLAGVGLERECHFIARDTLFKNRIFAKLFASLNAFGVKRGAADLGAIKESLRRLKSGALLLIFPEGTRTPDGTVGPMQPGVVLLARKAGVPIVPTLILGAFEAWPRQARLPRPLPIIVAYGQPVTAEQMAERSDEECIDLVHQRILQLMERYRQHPQMKRALRWNAWHAAPAPGV